MTDDKKVISPGSPGDDRTPDKTIGVIKYALEDKKKEEGGAGKRPQTTEGERAFPDRDPAKKKTGEF
jgi:hypothetical protein